MRRYGTITRTRLKNIDGDLVDVKLDPHWTEEESDTVLTVHVQRHRGKGDTPLGRIDTRENIYHVRHHDIGDFVLWQDRTTTLSVEELALAKMNEVKEIQYWDERNTTRYSISMDMLKDTGYIARRPVIGWRWAVPLMMWDKKKVA